MRQILDQKIRQGINSGANTYFIVLAFKLVDKKDQTTGASHKLLIFRAVMPAHGHFVDFARHHSGLEQFVGGVKIEIVGRNNMPKRFIQICLNDLVDHAELIAELTVRACLIQNPQRVFPKTTAHRQNGIILGEIGYVILPVSNGCARQMPGNFAQVGLHYLFNGHFGFRLLGQNNLANDRIYICIGKFHPDGETPLKFLQVTGAGYCCLTGANKKQFAANILAAGFHSLLNSNRALTIFSDILLYLVKHYKGQRELTILCQGLLNSLEHIIAGNIVHIRIQII